MGLNIVKTIGFRGGYFNQFYARTDPATGPGWYVFGVNPCYNNRYVMLCARPDVPPRTLKHYNGRVQRGYRTRKKARAVAAMLNARDRDCIGVMLPDSVDPSHGTKFRE